MIIAFQSRGSCTNSGCESRGAFASRRKKLIDERRVSVVAIGGLLHTAGLTTGQYIPLAVVMQDTLCCEMASERDASGIGCRKAVSGRQATDYCLLSAATARSCATKVAQRQPQALVQRSWG